GDDPVQWRHWGPEVLESARAGQRLIFISSGYFACHWCHVMQRESYRDPAIAALLNRHFIPVKIDCELEPALDAYLIRFVRRTRGSAGWPLNVFLTPEGYPLLGLTYAEPQRLRRLLEGLAGRWREQSGTLSRRARLAAAELSERAGAAAPGEVPDARRLRRALLAMALREGDDLEGGSANRRAFPWRPSWGC
ncbi:MAG: DUF255 domain-containing protein, partial [gamma proteobacterium symbiont of Phacoides pectinatus]